MIDPSAPAFPCRELSPVRLSGLTIRAELAKAAMKCVSLNDIDFGTVGKPRSNPFEWHAKKCVEFADALIVELNREGEK